MPSSHPLVAQFQARNFPSTVSHQSFGSNTRGWISPKVAITVGQTWLDPTVKVPYAFSATLGEGVGSDMPPSMHLSYPSPALTCLLAGILSPAKELDARYQKEDADSSKEVDFLLLVSTLLDNRRVGPL
jgi:hypothetical protein